MILNSWQTAAPDRILPAGSRLTPDPGRVHAPGAGPDRASAEDLAGDGRSKVQRYLIWLRERGRCGDSAKIIRCWRGGRCPKRLLRSPNAQLARQPPTGAQ